MGSFFGVTALGPESVFESNQLATLGAALFTDEEFTRAFNSLSTSASLPTSQLLPLLQLTFGFNPLPEEISLFHSALPEDEFSQAELLSALHASRAQLESLKLGATQYTSWEELNEDRRKGSRKKLGPVDVFKSPLTTQQAVGWDISGAFKIPRFPKRTCAETRFADAFFKSGWK